MRCRAKGNWRRKRDCSRLETAARPSLRLGPHSVRPTLLRKVVEPKLSHVRGFESAHASPTRAGTSLNTRSVAGERGIVRCWGQHLTPRFARGRTSCVQICSANLSNPACFIFEGSNPRSRTANWQRPATSRTRGKFWRRERDSNPRRAFDPYTLSRGAPSTTRPSLRGAQS
jgi:hypothetical protein